MTQQRMILRADGTSEPLAAPVTAAAIRQAVGDSVLCGVRLSRAGPTIVFSHQGEAMGLPVNEAATKLYHEACPPGNTLKVYGTAVVIGNDDLNAEFNRLPWAGFGMQREILKADGTAIPHPEPFTFPEVDVALNEAIPFTVRLPDGWVMLGDENGIAKGLPVNEAATKLYHSVCKPGTTSKVHGDVVVTLESDFGDGDDF